MKKIQPLNQTIEKFLPLAQKILDWMNQNPEISGQEKKTSAFLVKLLREQGYKVTSPIKRVKYSFLAKRPEDLNSKKPKVAILCEYDAVEHLGQSCGHSASCAASILCALALENSYEDFPFQLELIGTPNEEVAGGKIALLAKGVFDSYDFAILTQMSPTNKPCFQTVASSDLILHFYGKTAHASVNPWEGVNALNGVQLFFHAIDMLRPHLEPGNQVNGIIQDGGLIPNVIPQQSSAYVYLRANRYEQILQLKKRIETCAKGAAIATENKYDTAQLNPTYAEVFNGRTSSHLVCQVMEELHMECDTLEPIIGSSDVGNVNLTIPVFYPMISIGENVPLYSKEFSECLKGIPGQTGMKNGAMVMSKIIEHLAFHPEKLEQIKKEHTAYRNQSESVEYF